MKRKQFSEKQIIGILKEVEAGAVVMDQRQRFGYRRLHILMRRDGIERRPGGFTARKV
jgi:hypothetical protein